MPLLSRSSFPDDSCVRSFDSDEIGDLSCKARQSIVCNPKVGEREREKRERTLESGERNAACRLQAERDRILSRGIGSSAECTSHQEQGNNNCCKEVGTRREGKEGERQ